MTISRDVLDRITHATGAQGIANSHVLQELWGGYGDLFRAELIGSEHFSVIVKHIQLPKPKQHPRGWNTDVSHQRKLKSYKVEVNWYQQYVMPSNEQRDAKLGGTPDPCPMPNCLFVEKHGNDILLILQDLNTIGFTRVLSRANEKEIRSGLRWLAHFHARHLNTPPNGLWKTGTYWHLDTRPDELAALQDEPLKQAAADIDRALKQCPFQTLVHGDAKLANFVFSPKGERAAAVDFQYVGKGCGMKDVIMFLSSTVPLKDGKKRCPPLLDYYFSELDAAVQARNAAESSQETHIDFSQLEQAWRPLYSVAWADFQRFVKGWSPGHWKVHAYTEQLTQEALQQLRN